MPTEQRLYPANGIELCADTFGDARAPAIVLVMGLGAQMIAWDAQFCSALAARGFRVIRFDNRDVGKSTWLGHLGVPNTLMLVGRMALGLPLKVPYTLRDMAADTVGLLDALEVPTAHVVGVSMGGGIGQELDIHYSERVRTLTSIMSSTGNPRLPPPSPEALGLLFAHTPVGREAYVAHFQKMMRILRGPGFKEDADGDADRGDRNFDRGINPAGVARQLAAILASGDRTAALRQITTPTLVLHGDADPLIRIEGGRATAAAIPGAKFEILPQMGHLLARALWPQVIERIAIHAR